MKGCEKLFESPNRTIIQCRWKNHLHHQLRYKNHLSHPQTCPCNKLSITDIGRTYPLKRKGEKGYLEFGLLQDRSSAGGSKINNHCNKDQTQLRTIKIANNIKISTNTKIKDK